MNRALITFTLIFAGGACAPGNVSAGTTGTGTESGSSGGLRAPTTSSGTSTGSSTGTAPTSISIQPSNPTLTVQGGAAATAQLAAVGNNGQAVPATWACAPSNLASIGPSGVLTATGPLGGMVTVTATYGGLTATTQATVVISQVVYAGVTTAQASPFSGAPTVGGASSPSFVYPSDGVVIPVNLQPLNFQWQVGGANDLFEVTLTGPYGVLSGLVAPANPAQPSWQPDESVWNPFAQSNIGQTVTLSVTGAASGTPGTFQSPVQHLTLASSRFAGTIYYWTTSNSGQILQVSSNGVPQSFYTPPVGPADPAVTGPNTCMACHSVSRDGKQMFVSFYGTGPASVLDLDQSPVAPAFPIGTYDALYSAFDDTGALLLTTWFGGMTLRDATTGQPVPTGSGDDNLSTIGCGDAGTCTLPIWSADGKSMIYSQALPGHFYYDPEFDAADLMISQWSAASQTFSPPTTLVANDFDGNSLANFYATISIDNQLVAFNRAPCSMSTGSNTGSGVCLDTCPYANCGIPGNVPPGFLEIVPITGGTPIELKNAEGGDPRNWLPNFSPFEEGGYHWLAYFSLRDYGWLTNGNRQIWISAIDTAGNPTGNPSHPGFWLPGQSLDTDNNKAVWAALPCVGQGSGCQGDIDCCSSLVCRPVDGGDACVPVAQACGYAGNSCHTSADCCTPFQCLSGACGTGPLQ